MAGGIESDGGVFPPGSTFARFFGENGTAYGGTPNVYDPERSDSYEIGLKGRSFERRFAYNLAVYEYLYRDLQVGVLQASGAGSVVANIGHTTGRGVEADLPIAPNNWNI
jgi:iron complex outermembrane receptor protein